MTVDYLFPSTTETFSVRLHLSEMGTRMRVYTRQIQEDEYDDEGQGKTEFENDPQLQSHQLTTEVSSRNALCL